VRKAYFFVSSKRTVMELKDTLIAEHLSLRSRLDLSDFCDLIQESFQLGSFELDYENENEWGIAELEDFIELDISRPYSAKTLRKWDSTIPSGCNFDIMISVSRKHPFCIGQEWTMRNLIPNFAQKIADIFDTKVYHHRTWLGPGQSIVRKNIFSPDKSGKNFINKIIRYIFPESSADSQESYDSLETITQSGKDLISKEISAKFTEAFFKKAFEENDKNAIIELMPRLIEIEDKKIRDSIACHYIYNVFHNCIKDKDYEYGEKILDAYTSLVPQIGYIDMIGQGSETGRDMDMRQSFVSEGIVLSIFAKNDDIYKMAEILMPENVTDNVLAYNLACYHSLKNDKINMLKYINLALDLGKYRKQFLDESDFNAFKNDRDFLTALGVQAELTPVQKDIIERLTDFHGKWCDSILQPRSVYESEYLRYLDMLYETGWDGSLGCRIELFDDKLPERYVHKRTRLIKQLEKELADAAAEWRKVGHESDDKRTCLEKYKDIMEELFRIGHWSCWPGSVSLLPGGSMPEVYKNYWCTGLISEEHISETGIPVSAESNGRMFLFQAHITIESGLGISEVGRVISQALGIPVMAIDDSDDYDETVYFSNHLGLQYMLERADESFPGFYELSVDPDAEAYNFDGTIEERDVTVDLLPLLEEAGLKVSAYDPDTIYE
jgi:hypothetical protein